MTVYREICFYGLMLALHTILKQVKSAYKEKSLKLCFRNLKKKSSDIFISIMFLYNTALS